MMSFFLQLHQTEKWYVQRGLFVITLCFVLCVALCEWRHCVLVLQDEDSEFTLATDFEIGHFFRERIVPRAVLYFTGEALEDDESVSALPLKHTHTHVLSYPNRNKCDVFHSVYYSLKRRSWKREMKRWVVLIEPDILNSLSSLLRQRPGSTAAPVRFFTVFWSCVSGAWGGRWWWWWRWRGRLWP